MPEVVGKSEKQKSSEAEVGRFHDALGPFVVAAETTRMAMVFTDARAAGNPIIFANDSFLSLTGYRREEVLGQTFTFTMARGLDDMALAHVEAAFAGEAEGGYEIVYRRKDGTVFCSAILISPVRDDDGEIVQHFASFVDLTAHKQYQAQSTMLIGELNHRVKNTLATVQAIVSQSLRQKTDVGSIKESIESRLFALSRSHDLLTRESWRTAGLVDIVTESLAPFGGSDGRQDRFVVTGEDIRFPPQAVLALGIAFHELATNAVKYGSLSDESGSVLLSWVRSAKPDGDRIGIRWQEEGGPPVSPPTRRGFGSRVLESGLAHELGGTVSLDFRPHGLLCVIDLPAPRGASHA